MASRFLPFSLTVCSPCSSHSMPVTLLIVQDFPVPHGSRNRAVVVWRLPSPRPFWPLPLLLSACSHPRVCTRFSFCLECSSPKPTGHTSCQIWSSGHFPSCI